MGRTADEDPLAIAIAPPPGETEAQKQQRLHEEAEARRISDEIDQQLKEERAALKKKKKPIKVLLLGQSESGALTICLLSPFTASVNKTLNVKASRPR